MAAPTSSSAAADPAADLVGPGCSAYAAQNPTGPGSVAGMAQDPVATAASNNPMLSTLTSALSGKLNPQVNLVDTLNNGQYTVFAPTNAAFDKLPAATLDKLKTDAPLLKSILTYHVVQGQLSPAKVDGTHPTLQGASSTVTGQGSDLRVGNAGLVCGGVHTANATAYMIDTVLMPPGQVTQFVAGLTDPRRQRRRIGGMSTLAFVGFLGGLITGVSPCILPVLPVIFFSGAQGASGQAPESEGAVAISPKRMLSATLRPYRVIGGLVLSFSAVTLLGSALLSALHLPQDAIRWVALVALTAIGIGLISPRFEQLLERPFSRIPQMQITNRGGGFGLGLALGVLYVPCAGPVLAAIIVAGATANIGVATVVLTGAFALGATLPLLFFALAGQRVAERVGAFRNHQREIRVAAGVVTILLALALAFDLPVALQRAIPDYTGSLQRRVGGTEQIREKLNLGGIVNDQNAQLSNCSDGAAQLENCGTAPDLKGITGWLNTPAGQPIDLKSLRGKVVLIDFWAYSCINCQRAIPHVTGWYRAYHDSGFEVIGVHTPEYAFERVPGNVAKGAADLGITYPVALDNGYATWTNYRNRYWPAEYLVDADGVVRHIKFGEGDYSSTETLIRRLLADAKPGIKLPPPTGATDTTPGSGLTPETYLAVGKVVNYGGGGTYDEGPATFAYPPALRPDSFALSGAWSLDYQGATADSDDSAVRLNYHAKSVYVVAGGAGTLAVTRKGRTSLVPISGPPTAHQIVAGDQVAPGTLEVRLGKGLQLFSFTYG